MILTLNFYGYSCLHYAAEQGHLKVVKYFIDKHSFDPSTTNPDQITPLHLASFNGHLQVVSYLTLEKGCDPLCRDSCQDTPLHWAASEGRMEVVKFYIEELNAPLLTGEGGKTPLDYAKLYDHSDVEKYLLSYIK